MMRKNVVAGAMFVCMVVGAVAYAQAVFTKAQVADRIRRVEDGVDEFRKWSENRSEQGKNTAQAAKSSGRARGRTATKSQKEVANEQKDELDDALGDLNRSTNRLRRQFDPTDKWMETRPQIFDAATSADMSSVRSISSGTSPAHAPSSSGTCATLRRPASRRTRRSGC